MWCGGSTIVSPSACGPLERGNRTARGILTCKVADKIIIAKVFFWNGSATTTVGALCFCFTLLIIVVIVIKTIINRRHRNATGERRHDRPIVVYYFISLLYSFPILNFVLSLIFCYQIIRSAIGKSNEAKLKTIITYLEPFLSILFFLF